MHQSLTRGFFAYENSQPLTIYRSLGWLAVSALHCYTASEMQAKTGLDDWHIRTCNNWLLRLDECVNGMRLHIPAQHCAKPVSCIPVDTALFHFTYYIQGRPHCNKNLIYEFPEMKLCDLRSQFLFSCICEQFMYSQDWQQQNRQTDPGNV